MKTFVLLGEVKAFCIPLGLVGVGKRVIVAMF